MYKKKYSGWLKHADFLILDIIVLQLSFYIAYCIRHGIDNMYENRLYAGMAIVLLLADIVIGITFTGSKPSRHPSRWWRSSHCLPSIWSQCRALSSSHVLYYI